MTRLLETDLPEPRLTKFIDNFDDLKVTKLDLNSKSYKIFSAETKKEAKYQNLNLLDEETLNIPGNFSRPKPKTKDSNLRIKKVSADIDISSIISGKRNRTSKHDTLVAIFVEPENDLGVDSGEPFFSCLANAITTDKLEGKVNRKYENDI